MLKEPVGSLGSNKGELELRTEFTFQNGTITDGGLNKLKSVKKGSQKEFARTVRKVLKHAYEDDLFQHIANLNAIEDVEEIETVYELLLFKRYFALDGSPLLTVKRRGFDGHAAKGVGDRQGDIHSGRA